MSNKIQFLASTYALLLLLVYCCKVNAQKTDYTTILNDHHLQNGISLRGANTADQIVDKFIFPLGSLNEKTHWKIAEWGTKKPLSGNWIKSTDGEIIYANEAKRLGLLKVPEGVQIRMEVLAEHEYDKPREEGVYWPHLLLEQVFEPYMELKDLDTLLVNLSVKLLFSELKMPIEVFNEGLHSAQFQLFITLQNINPASKGEGDFLWFGIPFYDYRYENIPAYMAEDIGKDDASGKYIFMLSSYDVLGGSLHDKEWHHIHYDILPYLIDAFNMAKSKGYLRNTELKDLGVSGLNIGWENAGTINSGVLIKGFNILKKAKPNN